MQPNAFINDTLLSDQIESGELKVILVELLVAVRNNIEGDAVELGCYVGTTSIPIMLVSQRTKKPLHVYGSFQGLLEKTPSDQSPVGMQFQAGESRATKNISFVLLSRLVYICRA